MRNSQKNTNGSWKWLNLYSTCHRLSTVLSDLHVRVSQQPYRVGSDIIFTAKQRDTKRLSELPKAIQLINNNAAVWIYILLYISLYYLSIFSMCLHILFFKSANTKNCMEYWIIQYGLSEHIQVQIQYFLGYNMNQVLF